MNDGKSTPTLPPQDLPSSPHPTPPTGFFPFVPFLSHQYTTIRRKANIVPCNLPSVRPKRPLMAPPESRRPLVTLAPDKFLPWSTWQTTPCRGGTALMTTLISNCKLPVIKLLQGALSCLLLLLLVSLKSMRPIWWDLTQPNVARPVSIQRQELNASILAK